ncbi:MAG: hypothetical protein HOQ22_03535, partial [Nocardioidaceae bacterium]|nr:hypothetical protein [Nocardioidaceae bacterium]
PLVSPAHFVDLALEQVRAPVSPYYALLTELRRRVPAMESGRLFGADGQQLDRRTLSPQARRLLHDYRLVQYDLAMGHRWSEAALSGPVSGPSTPALASP